MPHLMAFFTALFAASLQEILHWYNLRRELSVKKYQKILASKGYWIAMMFMVISAGICCLIWYDGQIEERTKRDFFLFGLAFPLLIKRLISSLRTKDLELGTDTDKNWSSEFFK